MAESSKRRVSPSSTLPSIRCIDIFQSVSAKDRDLVAQQSAFRTVEAGESVFVAGEAVPKTYFVLQGVVVLQSDGRDSTVMEILGSDDIVNPLSALGAQGARYTASALTSSLLLAINNSVLRKLADARPNFRSALCNRAGEQLTRAFALASLFAKRGVQERLARFLKVLVDKFARRKGEVYRLNFSRRELALVSSTTVETCIRVTRKLESKGILRFPGRKLIEVVDYSKLVACGKG